jgi:hypothetical protein
MQEYEKESQPPRKCKQEESKCDEEEHKSKNIVGIPDSLSFLLSS